MQLFYVPTISGAEVLLDETESKHAIRVLRLKEDDEIELVDGKGGFYKARITDANPKKCKLGIINSQNEFGKKNFHLHIAIAPTKNIDRTEWFLEKCTEIGIDEITPLLSEHSERKVIKPERLEKILVSAMKQSVKAYLPKLNELTKLSDLLTQATETKKFIAHCNEGEKPHLKNVVNPGDNVLILIGPEGDFSPEEVELALANGFEAISLGDARLRTETAGVVACHIVNLAND
ncbi:16S rRNA (uracil(1498)-N(3))-methyltransferase [Draconibacterium sp. IB214405]|uniref:16S rRNA (uracil(1498)-N(3))-methyltransferase n=1 Tax=Draconibacterium sp. IB214405 TaxID=3097352 RepID=UPI002A16BA5F|nr:16S rRNA (uracil(1498)-N(3))-methyltransferase [Draconibacterium sp. IB214405]MDX8340015.1 16S rRNA (uracil(1498)-N(3))-methyltransferase [Draconibacterium sp. IB214405]